MGASLLTQADFRFARVRGRVELIERVLFQFPGGVPVRNEDALAAHTLTERVRVVAQGTLEEIAGG